MNTKDRDYLFDNLKLLLIFLVVFGHMISGATKNNPYCGILYYLIYSFHMPLFIFATGYFSKNVDKVRDKAFTSTLLSFLVFNGLYAICFEATDYLNIFRIHRNLWFLVVIFYYRIFLKDLVKVRFVLPLSVILSVVVGIFPRPGGYMAISRTVAFLPFFLLGHYCTKDHIQKIRQIPKWISAVILAGITGIMAIIYTHKIFNKAIFLYKNSYKYIGYSDKRGAFYRMSLIIIAIVVGICLINILSSKQYKFTKWGRNTFAIYISHTFVLQLLRDNGFFKSFNSNLIEIAVYVILSIALVAIFGLPKYGELFNKADHFLSGLLLKKEYND